MGTAATAGSGFARSPQYCQFSSAPSERVGLSVHPEADTSTDTCQMHGTPSPGFKHMLAIGQSDTVKDVEQL